MRNKYSKKYFLLLIFGLKAASFTFVTKQILLMLQKFSGILFLMSCSFLFAQKIPKTDNICFFQDGKTGKPITIVNDSLVYKGELKNPSRLKHTDYSETLNKYNYHFIINKHTYLVHDGCGIVLEYRNDSIVRIDNSFLHKNQYDALPFVYNNEICLFGGYGLFTKKNIITRYNFKLKEWFELPTKYTNRPSPRTFPYGITINNFLYLFGGFEKSVVSKYENKKNIYQLNLNTGEWIVLGKYNDEIFNLISNRGAELAFCTKKNIYIVSDEQIIEIDILKNSVSYYKNKNLVSLYKIYYDCNAEKITTLNNLSAFNILTTNIQSLNSILKSPFKTDILYSKTDYEYTIILTIAILLFIVYSIIKFTKTYKSNCIIYSRSKNKFFYKTKPLFHFDSMEEKILLYLFENRTHFIQLNQLNSFFESDKPDNYAAVVKKRDLVFNSLIFKLNSILHIEEDEIIISQKNETDKRIKEIKLNCDFFKGK